MTTRTTSFIGDNIIYSQLVLNCQIFALFSLSIVQDLDLMCLCSDCRPSCPALPMDPEVKDPIMVGALDLVTFILLMVFCLEVLIIVAVHFIMRNHTEKFPVKSRLSSITGKLSYYNLLFISINESL